MPTIIPSFAVHPQPRGDAAIEICQRVFDRIILSLAVSDLTAFIKRSGKQPMTNRFTDGDPSAGQNPGMHTCKSLRRFGI